MTVQSYINKTYYIFSCGLTDRLNVIRLRDIVFILKKRICSSLAFQNAFLERDRVLLARIVRYKSRASINNHECLLTNIAILVPSHKCDRVGRHPDFGSRPRG